MISTSLENAYAFVYYDPDYLDVWESRACLFCGIIEKFDSISITGLFPHLSTCGYRTFSYSCLLVGPNQKETYSALDEIVKRFLRTPGAHQTTLPYLIRNLYQPLFNKPLPPY